MKSNIAIVAHGPSRVDAPFSDSDVEIWGMNHHPEYYPRWDRWFQMHSNFREVLSKDDVHWLQQLRGKPIYMCQRYEDIPDSVSYPLDLVAWSFGRYFTSTAAYMIALACWARVHTLQVYGCDMTKGTKEEYLAQKPCIEYWLGVATGAGIRVFIPPESGLRQIQLYGYWGVKEKSWMGKYEEA